MIVHQMFLTVVMEFDLSHHSATKNIKENLANLNSTYYDKNYAVESGHGAFFDVWSNIAPDTVDFLSLPPFDDLKKELQLCVNRYAEALGLEDLIISNNWFNKMTVNSKTLPHRHSCSVCSEHFILMHLKEVLDLDLILPLIRMNEEFVANTDYNYNAYMPAKENTLYIF